METRKRPPVLDAEMTARMVAIAVGRGTVDFAAQSWTAGTKHRAEMQSNLRSYAQRSELQHRH
jgi:hypothetical protein